MLYFEFVSSACEQYHDCLFTSYNRFKVYKAISDSLEKSQNNELHCVKFHIKLPI